MSEKVVRQVRQKPRGIEEETRAVRSEPALAAPYKGNPEQPADPYAVVLADLRRKQVEIDIAIKAIEALSK